MILSVAARPVLPGDRRCATPRGSTVKFRSAVSVRRVPVRAASSATTCSRGSAASPPLAIPSSSTKTISPLSPLLVLASSLCCRTHLVDRLWLVSGWATVVKWPRPGANASKADRSPLQGRMAPLIATMNGNLLRDAKIHLGRVASVAVPSCRVERGEEENVPSAPYTAGRQGQRRPASYALRA
jgi:hypothetical protein